MQRVSEMALKPFFRVSRRSVLIKWLTGNPNYNRGYYTRQSRGKIFLISLYKIVRSNDNEVYL